jgi:DnaJ-class molecular chaperone
MRNPYDILGVTATASEAEIKKAYRRLAKRHHPDSNRDDPKAKDRFAEVNAAYEVVGDAEKRKAFDRGEIDAEGKPRFQSANGFGGGRAHAGGSPFETYEFNFGSRGPQPHGAGGAFEGADFADILSQAFGGARGPRGRAAPQEKGEDIDIVASATLEDIASGTPLRVTLPGGRTVEVAIPESALDGRKLRLRGQGKVSLTGHAGDAMVSVKIAPHALFRRDGRNLHLDLPLTVDEAVLGASVRVPTLTGAVELTIPAGANDGRVLRLRGKGLPAGKGHGDLLVTLRIRLPEADSRLRQFAEALRESGSYKPRGPEFG